MAVSYTHLIAAIILLHCSFRYQVLITLLLLLLYWIPMTLFGDFTPGGNFAEKVDRLVTVSYKHLDVSKRQYSFSDERVLLWRFMRGGCNIASDASSLVSSDLAHMQL